MRYRLDSPEPTATRGRHTWTTEGYRSPVATQPTVVVTVPPPPEPPRLGPTCDWLFVKGGMSVVMILGLLAIPFLATLPGARIVSASLRPIARAHTGHMFNPRTGTPAPSLYVLPRAAAH